MKRNHLSNSKQWVDEDEQNEAADDDYANNFGGGGMPGMGGDGGLGGIDFSKMGPGGGVPDMEGLGGGDDDGEESDDEPPGLADEAEAGADVPGEKDSSTDKGKGKIEEIA